MCTAAGKKLDTVQSATDTNVYTYSCK
jgi:hypothetical protein